MVRHIHPDSSLRMIDPHACPTTTLLLFGATGDLARRKLLPGLPSSTPNGRFGCFPTADPIGINNLAASR